jgi:hypothetical protein
MRKQIEKKFPKHWNTTSETILDAASVLVEAHTRPDYKQLKKSWNLSDRTSQALVKIGKMKRFYDADVRPLLPDSWGTLEVLSAITGRKFEELVSTGKLNKNFTRKSAESILYGATKTPQEDWSQTEKLLTVRVGRNNKNPEYIKRVKEALYQTIETLREFEELVDVQIEDHHLDERVADSLYRQAAREMKREEREGFNWGVKICKLRRRQLKAAASPSERKQVACGQLTRNWSMEETKVILDKEGLERAFSELGIDWIDVDELLRDPDLGKRAFEKLKKQSY